MHAPSASTASRRASHAARTASCAALPARRTRVVSAPGASVVERRSTRGVERGAGALRSLPAAPGARYGVSASATSSPLARAATAALRGPGARRERRGVRRNGTLTPGGPHLNRCSSAHPALCSASSEKSATSASSSACGERSTRMQTSVAQGLRTTCLRPRCTDDAARHMHTHLAHRRRSHLRRAARHHVKHAQRLRSAAQRCQRAVSLVHSALRAHQLLRRAGRQRVQRVHGSDETIRRHAQRNR